MHADRGDIALEGNLEETLLRLERQLMDALFREDRTLVANLLAEDFQEYGSSGRIWSRSDVLAAKVEASAPLIENFAVNRIVPELAQATYCTSRLVAGKKPQSVLRSSLWVRQGGGWKMLFHQGTKVPDA